MDLQFIVDMAMQWWQFTIVGCLILLGFIINLFGVDNNKERIGFNYKEMPKLQPIAIATAGKGFWSAIWMWLTGTRHWVVAQDWEYEINGTWYVVPAGFQFDGASIPKFLHTWLSPTGVLLMGGLVHDFAYKYATLLESDKY